MVSVFFLYSSQISAHQMIAVIAFRCAVRAKWENGRDVEGAKKAFLEVLGNPSRSLDESADVLIGNPPYSLAVRDQDTFEASFLVQKLGDSTSKIQKVAQSCAEDWRKGIAAKLALYQAPSLVSSAMLGVSEGELYDVLGGRASISVNLNADNETLRRDSDFWLAMARRDVPERQIGPKELKRWKDLSCIAAFDLKLWADIHGGNYTAAQMGAMLWPDDAANGTVDTTERYRKLTAPQIEEMFDFSTVERLIAQSVSMRVHNNLAKLMDEASSGKKN